MQKMQDAQVKKITDNVTLHPQNNENRYGPNNRV